MSAQGAIFPHPVYSGARQSPPHPESAQVRPLNFIVCVLVYICVLCTHVLSVHAFLSKSNACQQTLAFHLASTLQCKGCCSSPCVQGSKSITFLPTVSSSETSETSVCTHVYEHVCLCVHVCICVKKERCMLGIYALISLLCI